VKTNTFSGKWIIYVWWTLQSSAVIENIPRLAVKCRALLFGGNRTGIALYLIMVDEGSTHSTKIVRKDIWADHTLYGFMYPWTVNSVRFIVQTIMYTDGVCRSSKNWYCTYTEVEWKLMSGLIFTPLRSRCAK